MTSKPLSANKQKLAKRRALVKQHYSTMSNPKLAKLTGISVSTISQDALLMGLTKPFGFASAIARASKRTGVEWTPILLEVFELMYPDCDNGMMGEFFGVTRGAICNVAQVHGWNKEHRGRKPRPSRAKRMDSEKRPAQQGEKPKRLVHAAMQLPDADRCNMQIKGPPPMNAAQLARKESERISYQPDQIPWRARAMSGPAWTPPPMTHRSSPGAAR